MSKVFALVAVLAVAVYCHPTPPTASEQQAALVAAGVSAEAAAGLVAIGQKYQTQFENATDPSAVKTVVDSLHAEQQTYIKTQSSADQTAFAAYIEKEQAEHKNHTPPTSSK